MTADNEELDALVARLKARACGEEIVAILSMGHGFEEAAQGEINAFTEAANAITALRARLEASVKLMQELSATGLADKKRAEVAESRVAELEQLAESAMAAQESTAELLAHAESQLQQVKADAERMQVLLNERK